MAIDNNSDTAAITKKLMMDQYWFMKFDSVMEFYIARIFVHLEADGIFEFITGKSIQQGRVCNKTVIHSKPVTGFSVRCMKPLIGNNIWIRKSGNGSLILYEVTVFICSTNESNCFACKEDCKDYICKPETDICPNRCSDGTFHPSCNQCQNGVSSINCNENCQSSGTCFACPRGKFGDRCEVNCPTTCKNSTCHRLSGKCLACPPGVFGDKCETNCQSTCTCTEGLDKTHRTDSHCDKTCFDTENTTIYETSDYNSSDPGCLSVCNQTMCIHDDRSSFKKSDGCSYCLKNYILNIHDNSHHDENCSIYIDTFCKLNCSSSCKACLTKRKCNMNHGEEDTLRGNTIIFVIALASSTIICIAVAVALLLRYFRCRTFRLPKPNVYNADLNSTQGEDVFSFNEEDGYQNLEMTPNPLNTSMEAIYSNGFSESTSNLTFCEVPTDRFVHLVKSLRYNDRLKEEYKMLPEGLLSQCNEAMKPFNRCLNRFRDLYPYDFNRVVLESATQCADYINASYVHGYKCKNRYVAAQGPFTDQTVINFWRMIWHLNCTTIVMLSQLTDKGVMKYWPDDEVQHGNIYIRTLTTALYPSYTLRKFEISTIRDKKEVTQFHFTAWQRKGVPQNKSSIFKFREAVKQNSFQSSPIVIHCSGGVGRTGTFMAYDYLLEEAESKGSLDVLNCVCRMRRQRTNVIQSLEQYEFLYEILAESLNRMFVMISEQELYD